MFKNITYEQILSRKRGQTVMFKRVRSVKKFICKHRQNKYKICCVIRRCFRPIKTSQIPIKNQETVKIPMTAFKTVFTRRRCPGRCSRFRRLKKTKQRMRINGIKLRPRLLTTFQRMFKRFQIRRQTTFYFFFKRGQFPHKCRIIKV